MARTCNRVKLGASLDVLQKKVMFGFYFRNSVALLWYSKNNNKREGNYRVPAGSIPVAYFLQTKLEILFECLSWAWQLFFL